MGMCQKLAHPLFVILNDSFFTRLVDLNKNQKNNNNRTRCTR